MIWPQWEYSKEITTEETPIFQKQVFPRNKYTSVRLLKGEFLK